MRRPFRWLVPAAVALLVQNTGAQSTTITIESNQWGTTPDVLGYNMAHFVDGSNAADLWRYSGVKAARAFISASHIEPTDDLAPIGDGVTSQSGFESRKAALRAHVVADTGLTGTTYVHWPAFVARYAMVDADSNNRLVIDTAFARLRSQGVEILANITCSPSRFPLASLSDWPNVWEIWQHYYAQAFYLARAYDVARYGVFNEPNGWVPAIGVDDWWRRVRIASDAVQAAVADVNAVTGKSLQAEVFAPNTANGATKYDDAAAGDTWGQTAVRGRHVRLDGTTDPAWWNFHVYNYQRYSTNQYDTTTSDGYIDDYDRLTAKMLADLTGEPLLPIALTEFNARTAANYDTRTNTSDTPADYATLGASLVALTRAQQLYLFKFGMTERDSASTYPVAKNGTHYVDNAGALRSYGGPSSTAEVYRLFVQAAGRARPIYRHNAPANVWTMPTKDAETGVVFLFVANRNTTSASVSFNVSALGVPNGSRVVVQEVSTAHKGGVRLVTSVASGVVPAATLPAESVWLVSILPSATREWPELATEDTLLADGTGSPGRTSTGGTATRLLARSDGTVNGRRVSLLKFPVTALLQRQPLRVLLSVRAAGTASSSVPVQAHVYGLSSDAWTSATATFAGLAPVLKQSVAAGNEIANNLVEDGRASTQLLGQVSVQGTTVAERLVDVTGFVRAQTDGMVSFLMVQDHRWTRQNQLDSGVGDTQPAGVQVLSRENAGSEPRLRAFHVPVPGLALPPPTGLTVTVLKQTGSLRLAWTAVADAASYRVYRSTTAGGPYAPVAASVTGTSYTNTGLVSGTRYHYVVRSVTGDTAESTNSNEASAVAR